MTIILCLIFEPAIWKQFDIFFNQFTKSRNRSTCSWRTKTTFRFENWSIVCTRCTWPWNIVIILIKEMFQFNSSKIFEQFSLSLKRIWIKKWEHMTNPYWEQKFQKQLMSNQINWKLDDESRLVACLVLYHCLPQTSLDPFWCIAPPLLNEWPLKKSESEWVVISEALESGVERGAKRGLLDCGCWKLYSHDTHPSR